MVVAFRERFGRTLTYVRKSEAEGVDITMDILDRDTALFADEASHWDVLEGRFDTARINHSELYSEGHGKHTNWVESYFSRLRRMVAGQHHQVSPKYLHQYANHAAWIEDHRTEDNKDMTFRALRNTMWSPVFREFKGYWQRAA